MVLKEVPGAPPRPFRPGLRPNTLEPVWRQPMPSPAKVDTRPSSGSGAADGLFRLADAPHRIGVVRLVVRDLASVSAFYRKMIGLETLEAGTAFERLGVGRTVLLELEHRLNAQPQSRRDAGLFHTAFLLPSREDLGSWLRFAAAARLPIQGASDHRVSEAVYLADPEGNGIEIYSDRPLADWPRRAGVLEMSTDPLDIEGLMRAAANRAWTGFPDDGTIGHIHLQVGALAESDAFYNALLGFAVTCRYPGASFYGSGGYHHQLAGNIWNSRGARPRTGETTGLEGFELLTPDPTVLSLTRQRLIDTDVTPVETSDGLELRDPWGTRVCLRDVSQPARARS
jgi:catechol 2,3-dioxygenase